MDPSWVILITVFTNQFQKKWVFAGQLLDSSLTSISDCVASDASLVLYAVRSP